MNIHKFRVLSNKKKSFSFTLNPKFEKKKYLSEEISRGNFQQLAMCDNSVTM